MIKTEPLPLWQTNYSKYRGRVILSDRARSRLRPDHCVIGWVLVGTYPGVIRGATEHPSVWSYSPDRARFFRNYQPRGPEWISDGFRLQSDIDRVRTHLETDILVGHGLVWTQHNIDDSSCPIHLDWADFEKSWQEGRGRNSHYHRANIRFFARAPD